MEENIKNITIHTPSEEDMKEAHNNYMRFLRENPNNFSFWFPKLNSVKRSGIMIPKSRVIEVPEEIYKAFFMENKRDKKTIRLWAHDAILPVIQQHFSGKELFVKNGCYSGKFNFNKCCHIPADATLKEIVEHLCEIQYDSLMKETSGNLEIVLREWIQPEECTKTIYGGMPLRPEIRLFYDFDTHRPLYWINYWDWDYCHDYICCHDDDKPVYEEYYPFIDEEVKNFMEEHYDTICNALQEVTLMKGIWSVDFLLERNRVWFIVAALGHMSAYWDEEKINQVRGL